MVKKASWIVLMSLGVALPASAYWGDNWGGYNNWPTWTPMYWMEEAFDNFDDDSGYRPWGNNRYGGYPRWGNGAPYYPQGGYAPYGAVPYYGGYGQMPYYQGAPYGYAPYYPQAVPAR
ncbi:MAG: sulfur globule protein CV1 [Proteobacteria bacterium]|nr:sulfur globule protein CV1 [Pseudomonadota bacterium]